MTRPPLDLKRLYWKGKDNHLADTPPPRIPPRHRHGQLFLKGPIPLDWLRCAAQQPGRALTVAVELWFRAGVKRRRTIRISLSHLQVAPQLSRSSASRGLSALERAGLVTVIRRQGRKPTVTLQDAHPNDRSSE